MTSDLATSATRSDANTLASSAAWWVIALLFAFSVATFPQAGLVIDSGRDLANAWVIAQGEFFPLAGPDIFGTWKLGPAWFYLLAVPLLFGASLFTVSLWVGALASLKIPLAYLLGRRCYGPAGGLGLAAAVAMPGWGSVEAMVLAHTSLVETGVLASILMSWRAFRLPTTGRLTMASLMLALAMHAHPTAIVVSPWLAAALWQARKGNSRIAIGVAALLGFSLPWLPMLYGEAQAGWPQIAATQRYLSSGESSSWLSASVASAHGLITGAPTLVSSILLPQLAGLDNGLSLIWFGLLAVAGLGTVAAAFREPGLTLIVWAQLVFALLLVFVLRRPTPVYMVFALLPLFSWACVHGWRGALGLRASSSFFWAVALLSTVGNFAVVAQRTSLLSTGSLAIPGAAFGDVAQPVEQDGYLRPWLAIGLQEEAVGDLCAPEIALHGELATALQLASNVAIASACGSNQGPQLLGSQATRHVLAMPAAVAERLALEGQPLVRGWTAFEPTAILFPRSGLRPTVDPEYAVNRYREQASPSSPQRLFVQCSENRMIAVTNLLPGLNVIEVIASRTTPAGSISATPYLTTLAASYFRCWGTERFEIELQGADLASVDVVTIN